jgi:tetratricopeptide (TPR) repeat protein
MWAGRVYTDLRDWKKAKDLYHRALEVNPGAQDVLLAMGDLLLKQGHYDSAAVFAAKAIEQAPGIVEFDGQDGYKLLASTLPHIGRADELLTTLQSAADKYGTENPLFYTNLGNEQCLSGQFHQAISSYQRHIEMSKENHVLARLGMAQWLAGDTEAALESLREATSFGGTRFEYMLIELLKYLGRFDDIEKRLNSYREADDAPALIWWVIVDYLSSMHRYDDALAFCEEMRESGEATFESDMALMEADWHRQKGDLDKAREILNAAEAVASAGYHPYSDLERIGFACVEGDIPKAIQLAESVVEGTVGDVRHEAHRALLAMLYYASGKTGEALRVLRETKPHGYGRDGPLYRRGQLEAAVGSAEAETLLDEALFFATRSARGESYRTKFGHSRSCCALAAARLGESERAKAEIEYAIRLDPEDAEVAYKAACAYSLIADTQEALQWLQTAVERGHRGLWWARVDPDLDPLREEPRFREIMSNWDSRLKALRN